MQWLVVTPAEERHWLLGQPTIWRVTPATGCRSLLHRLRRIIRFTSSRPGGHQVARSRSIALPKHRTYAASGCMCHDDVRGVSTFPRCTASVESTARNDIEPGRFSALSDAV